MKQQHNETIYQKLEGKEIKVFGEKCRIKIGEYENGRTAMVLFDAVGEQFAVPTVNLPFRGLEEDEVYALLFHERRIQNCTLSGAQLMNEGFTVKDMSGDYASEIIWIQLPPRGPACVTLDRQKKI